MGRDPDRLSSDKLRLGVVIGCECSGMIRRAMARRGHFAVSVDIQPPDDGAPPLSMDSIAHMPHSDAGWHHNGDLIQFMSRTRGLFDLGIFHPECTFLTNSGVQWLHHRDSMPDAKVLKGKPRWEAMNEAAAFYVACRHFGLAHFAIENPIMHEHAFRLIGRRADQFVQPWWFGSKRLKATGFELHGLPLLQKTSDLRPPKSKAERDVWAVCWRMAPTKDPALRKKMRSETDPAVAEAIADQWTRPEIYQ